MLLKSDRPATHNVPSGMLGPILEHDDPRERHQVPVPIIAPLSGRSKLEWEFPTRFIVVLV